MPEFACVQVKIKRAQHAELFAWLDHNTPGWSFWAVTNLYEFLIENRDIHPDDLMDFLRRKEWEPEYAGLNANPVIIATPEQCTLVRMFWPDSSVYEHES